MTTIWSPRLATGSSLSLRICCTARHFTDAFVIYRAYRKPLFYELGFDTDKGFTRPERWFNTRVSIEPLLSVRAAKKGYKIGKIPADEPPRIAGERKLQVIRWGLTFLYQFIAERFSRC